MKLAIYGKNIGKEHHHDIKEFFEFLNDRGIQFIVHRHMQECTKSIAPKGADEIEYYDSAKAIDSSTSFMISIGGDGTFLDTILLVRDSGVPVLGINTGRLGFLSNTPTSEINNVVAKLLDGKYSIEQRSMLQLESKNKHFGEDNFALNEISLLKSDSSSMITIVTKLNGNHLNDYWTDGLIISTATGSTAYSLSCGGPIMMPGSGNFVITPIAPHNLNVRPIVIDDDAVLQVTIESRTEKNLISMDSRSREIHNGEVITIKKANHKLNLVQLNSQEFITSLRNKLHWGLDKRNR